MRCFLLLAMLFSAQYASAEEPLGRKIDFYKEREQPRFGVIYANDADKAWTANFALWGGELTNDYMIKTLAWRLYDAKTKKPITGWQWALFNQEPVMYPGTLALSADLRSEAEVLAAIRALPNLVVLFALNQNPAQPMPLYPTHYLDLGAYCASHPKNFQNLTNGKNGCR